MNDVRCIQVAAGLIVWEGRYLITRRKQGVPLGGFWEFPGGKRESGESLEDCLRRELREELGVEITTPVLFRVITHDYPDRSVELHFFRCHIGEGQPRPLGSDGLRWVTPSQFKTVEFPPADRALLEALEDEAARSGR